MADRPLRYCDICGQLDNHPRHVQASVGDGFVPTDEFLAGLPAGPPQAVAWLMDPNLTIAHMDCCAAAGCPTCAATEAATGGLRGQALIDGLAAGALNDVEV